MKLPTLYVLKIGGQLIEEPDRLQRVLTDFANIPGHCILVHGGGRRTDQILQALDIQPRMIDGRRITDAPTLEVATMVYAGLVNKQLVSRLQALGCQALGLSGADGDAIRAERRPAQAIDYGFAGDIRAVNTELLNLLLSAGITPVCCAITHDGQGQLLNTNADTIAATVAEAMAETHEVTLGYCFEKPGVLADAAVEDSLLSTLSPKSYAGLKANGAIFAGMIPKLDNAFAALQNGVKTVQIGNPQTIFKGTCTRLRLDV